MALSVWREVADSPRHRLPVAQLLVVRRLHTMKIITLPFAAAMLVALTLNAQTSAPTSLILPPEHWDIKTHALFAFSTTNKPGNYSLQPLWAGVEKVTIRTGWFAQEYEARMDMSMQTNKFLKFDRLTVCSGPILPVIREDRYICDAVSGKAPGPAYRQSLPTDSELRAMHDVSSVTSFFGWNPFGHWQGAQSVGMTYFSLGPYNSIDTLHVEFMKKGESSDITGILVRRGHCNRQ